MTDLLISAADDVRAAASAHTRQQRAGTRIWVLVAAIALTGAAAELVVVLIRKAAFGHVLRISRDIVWMAPLAELMLLLPAVALFYAFTRLRRRWWTPRSVAFVALFVVTASALVATGILNDLAVLLLAAGLAWQAAGWFATTVQSPGRPLKAGLITLLMIFPLLGAGVHIGDAVRERRMLASLPAAKSGAPNVILIIWDTVRAASLSLYGHERPTSPNLQKLAESGVVFEHALSTTSWTLPSHVSMFTGLLPHHTRAGWVTPFSGQERTLAEALSQRGYATAAFAANVLYVQWENGLQEGFARFEDYRITPGQVFLGTALGRRIATGRHGWGTGVLFRLAGYTEFLGRKRADHVNSALLDWVDRRGEQPYFAVLNYFDAHLPYLPPEPFAGMFQRPRPRTTLLDRVKREIDGYDYWDIPAAAIAAEVAAYEESIAYLDDRLGSLLEELEERGELDNTLIIVTSDHGEEFGEHGDFEHGTNLYLEQINVPLVIAYPDHIPSNLHIENPVSLRDIPATIMDLTQGDTTSFPGRTLARWWLESDDMPRTAIAELAPGLHPDELLCAAMGPRFHLVVNPDGERELYDWRTDPAEEHDIFGRTVRSDSVAHLERVLADRSGCRQ